MAKKQGAQRFDPVNSHSTEPAPTAGFRFLKPNHDTIPPRMKYVLYRPPVLKKAAREWYIEYWYRVPAELHHIYKKDWKRFRVFEDINRIKTDDYANLLRDAVEKALELGYNPFEQKRIAEKLGTVVHNLNIKEGLEAFLKKKNKKGLDPSTLRKYNQIAELLNAWFLKTGLQKQPIEKITKKVLENFLDDAQTANAWGNRQYNNMKSMCYTIFGYFKSEGWINTNPAEGIEARKATAGKYRYFDKGLFPKITTIIKENDPYLWCAFQFVYYLAVRSNKELRLLKVGGILNEGEQYRFEAASTKARRADVISIDPHLKKVMQEMGLFTAKPNDYIFTAGKKPGVVPIGINFFTKRFSKIRTLAGLSNEYSLYSAKHSRAVHLIKDGVKLADISILFRHESVAVTATYCRNLGLDFDAKDLMGKSREI